jgi:hypothetical protein
VVVAVILVRPVEPSLDEVIDVIAVGHGLVAALLAVGVPSPAVSGAGVSSGMLLIDRDHMLIHVVPVRVMQVPVVQVVDVIVVLHRGVPAPGPVLMGVLALVNVVGHVPDLTGAG